MTVKSLRDRLKNVDDDMEVVIITDHGQTWESADRYGTLTFREYGCYWAEVEEDGEEKFVIQS